MRKWGKVGTGIVITTIVMSMTGCGGSSATTSSSNVPKVTETNKAQFLQDADKFKGADATLQGKVFIGTKNIGDMTAFQMQVDNHNVVVNLNGQNADIKENDFVEVTGRVQGVMEGTNAFGAKISAPVIQLESVKKIDPLSVLSPTIKSLQVDKTLDQHGLSLTVNKIDFAKDEQRVYITIKNGTQNKAYFFVFEAKAVQDGQQLDSKISDHVIDAKETYKEIPSDLLPGVSANGVIVFKGLSPDKPFKLTLSAHTDDFETNFNPYTFDIPVAK
ncbi:hypothetical protein DNHGIG_00790 [Collibacillus ludicampi]|uniref:DUF4352 domain-containing protein n=1 Tax=Collibacillus ludicampi TaxID=2771369 RepID=A0AAV4L9R4_9BACL|nr:hypothetical protein [Collibacillus ludicampi]GIM44530.1 hypothetical protein DNHGIG_00790 [Collibacillus ludicampi]